MISTHVRGHDLMTPRQADMQASRPRADDCRAFIYDQRSTREHTVRSFKSVCCVGDYWAGAGWTQTVIDTKQTLAARAYLQ